MTKKNFIALAEALLDATSKGVYFSHTQIEVLARFCQEQSPNFNRSRWLGFIAGTNGKNGGKVR